MDIVFTNYLRHWNGLDYVPLVLKHLARSRMYSFECKYIIGTLLCHTPPLEKVWGIMLYPPQKI